MATNWCGCCNDNGQGYCYLKHQAEEDKRYAEAERQRYNDNERRINQQANAERLYNQAQAQLDRQSSATNALLEEQNQLLREQNRRVEERAQAEAREREYREAREQVREYLTTFKNRAPLLLSQATNDYWSVFFETDDFLGELKKNDVTPQNFPDIAGLVVEVTKQATQIWAIAKNAVPPEYLARIRTAESLKLAAKAARRLIIARAAVPVLESHKSKNTQHIQNNIKNIRSVILAGITLLGLVVTYEVFADTQASVFSKIIELPFVWAILFGGGFMLNSLAAIVIDRMESKDHSTVHKAFQEISKQKNMDDAHHGLPKELPELHKLIHEDAQLLAKHGVDPNWPDDQLKSWALQKEQSAQAELKQILGIHSNRAA